MQYCTICSIISFQPRHFVRTPIFDNFEIGDKVLADDRNGKEKGTALCVQLLAHSILNLNYGRAIINNRTEFASVSIEMVRL